jgi:hypothetical protein
MDPDHTLKLLAREAGVEAVHHLRRTHTFKIGVNFDPKSLQNQTAATRPQEVEPVSVGTNEAGSFVLCSGLSPWKSIPSTCWQPRPKSIRQSCSSSLAVIRVARFDVMSEHYAIVSWG